MCVFSDAVNSSYISLGCGISDPLSIRRPDRFIFATFCDGYLAYLAAEIDREDIRIVIGIRIGFVIRQKNDLISPRTKTHRMIVERTEGELSWFWLFSVN